MVKLIVDPELSVYGWGSYDVNEVHRKYDIDIPNLPQTWCSTLRFWWVPLQWK